MSDEFYIGYETSVPAGSRRLVRTAITVLLALAAALAAMLVAAQQEFADATFAFGRVEDFGGTIVANPYPILLTGEGPAGLVAEGKHGALSIVRPFDGRPVKLRGTRIHRDGQTLIEVEAGSVTADATGRVRPAPPADVTGAPSATTTLIGEIVDAKCYLGVMNPGAGAVHRDCAGICIRGGLPPMFATVMNGAGTLLRMAARDGRALGPAIADLAGKRVTVTGSLWRDPHTGHWTWLADVEDYRLAR